MEYHLTTDSTQSAPGLLKPAEDESSAVLRPTSWRTLRAGAITPLACALGVPGVVTPQGSWVYPTPNSSFSPNELSGLEACQEGWLGHQKPHCLLAAFCGGCCWNPTVSRPCTSSTPHSTSGAAGWSTDRHLHCGVPPHAGDITMDFTLSDARWTVGADPHLLRNKSGGGLWALNGGFPWRKVKTPCLWDPSWPRGWRRPLPVLCFYCMVLAPEMLGSGDLLWN